MRTSEDVYDVIAILNHYDIDYHVIIDEGEIKTFINMNDRFIPSSADAEEFTWDDIDDLVQAYKDLPDPSPNREEKEYINILKNHVFADILWAARKRKSIPLKVKSKNCPEKIKEIFRKIKDF